MSLSKNNVVNDIIELSKKELTYEQKYHELLELVLNHKVCFGHRAHLPPCRVCLVEEGEFRMLPHYNQCVKCRYNNCYHHLPFKMKLCELCYVNCAN